jgi:alkylation response protein AidB-like acyl-CoA dehydrogenase
MILSEVFPVPVEWLDTVEETMADTVAGWAEREVSSKRLEHGEDREKLLAPATKSLFVDIGLQSIMVPERLGGGGMDSPEAVMTACASLEAVGTVDTGIGFAAANTLAFISSFGLEPGRDDALLDKLAPVFTGGEPAVATLVLPAYADSGAEGNARFNGLDYQVVAAPDDNRFALSGRDVRPQCCGTSAALFAFAFDSGKAPAFGIVSRQAQGLTIGDEFLKTGLAASDNAELVLDSVRVPSEDVVCTGPEEFLSVLDRYYLFCAAVTSGALLATYGILKEWGDTRVIKGKGQVFKENPLVASMMGEVGANTARTRMLTYQLARMLSKPDVYGPPGAPALNATATAVFKGATGAAMRAMDATMELMGSAGYATEWNLERYWRDIKTLEATVVPETAALVDMARHYFGLKTL